jgi:uncharacterized protein YndB with AHSA1/START domain
MTVVSVTPDPQSLTLTLVLDLAATLERAWQLWADPRQLERWWGPPTYPATVTRHELTPGGEVHYVMTGPQGEKAPGLWRVLEVVPERRIVADDLFADDEGAADESRPTTRMVVTLEPGGSGTVATVVSTFASTDQMEQLVAWGMVEGSRQAAEQIDALLAEG